MKRGIVARSLALVLAIFFASGSVLPSLGDPCPVHDPGAAQLAMMIHAGHSASGITHHAAEHFSHGDTRAPANHHSHHCNCIGAGCCTASVMLPPTALTFAPADVSAESTAPLAPTETRGRSAVAHTQPFSTAPPQLEA
jgi:hypothetical protein